MNDELKNFVTGIGALAEALRLFRDELLKNGFSRDETIFLTKAFLQETLSAQKNKEED